ncbi:MAG: membrane dipeptidase [Deltaproteobacteria bacterium]|nr:membrane dipeptidase [Deltaproteobacteria bacterium]
MTEEKRPGGYDFGLTDAQENRSMHLHQKSLIIDMVCQHPGGANIFKEIDSADIDAAVMGKQGWERYAALFYLPYDLAISGKSLIIQKWWHQSGVTGCPIGIRPDAAMEGIFGEIRERLLGELSWTRQVLVAEDFKRAKKENTTAFFGYCQPVTPIPRDINTIDAAYHKGLRVLMLTYNSMDHTGAGCTERVDAGLSNYGVEVVKRCNELGIVVDTAHCGKQTTLDACLFSRTPVVATHTASSSVYLHARGKSDEELKAIADTGGVIGIVTVPFFLSPDPVPTIEHMLDHIDYVANLVGPLYVGIGTDWPLQVTHAEGEATLGGMLDELGFRSADNIRMDQTLKGFRDGRDFPNITRGLLKRGYSDDQIRGILGENFLRVFKEVCG